jgi:hypothetical protein
LIPPSRAIGNTIRVLSLSALDGPLIRPTLQDDGFY